MSLISRLITPLLPALLSSFLYSCALENGTLRRVFLRLVFLTFILNVLTYVWDYYSQRR
jgi:hypothetical protein